MTPPPADGTTPPTELDATGDPAVQAALTEAQTALAESDAALRAGDFAAYGVAQARLRAAIERALAAGAAVAGSATPAPTSGAEPTDPGG
jgi:uncharacterized protein